MGITTMASQVVLDRSSVRAPRDAGGRTKSIPMEDQGMEAVTYLGSADFMELEPITEQVLTDFEKGVIVGVLLWIIWC